ncbi:MAG: hypothetical protein GVX78_04070 [Bacteroidetes bacterium]|jgi:uncharacterized SAM-binding protein YcdF (DUF218 family)|nr:hypothetical protein [Bacteroidota bacterium]
MIRSLVHLLIDPQLYIIIGFLLLWAFAWQKGSKKVRIFLFLGLASAFLVLGLPIVDYLVKQNESHYPVLKPESLDTSKSYLIVVLGAGKTSDPKLMPTQQINRKTAVRLIEGIRIYNKLPRARLALSGAYFDSQVAQAEVTASAAVDLGVNEKDTIQLRHGTNTEAEARQATDRKRKGEHMIVVSSAIHLKRAHFWFSHFGTDPILAPANFYIKSDPGSGKKWWQNSASKRLTLWNRWLHEWIGLWHAKFVI